MVSAAINGIDHHQRFTAIKLNNFRLSLVIVMTRLVNIIYILGTRKVTAMEVYLRDLDGLRI